MLTKEQVFNELNKMGAPQDKIVIVHASLKAVGEIEGGGEALLDWLIEYFTKNGGIFCVPTHTWHNVSKNIVLDMNSPDVCVGTLSKLAVLRRDGYRTSNPTHSLMLFGDKDKISQILQAEKKVEKPTDKNGAYSKIDYVLLVGVNQNKNTYIHYVEEFSGINRFNSEPTKMKIKHVSGEIEEKLFYEFNEEDVGDVSTRFSKFEPAFRFYGGIVDGFIGSAKTGLCSAKIILETMKLIRENSGKIDLLKDDAPLKKELYRRNTLS